MENLEQAVDQKNIQSQKPPRGSLLGSLAKVIIKNYQEFTETEHSSAYLWLLMMRFVGVLVVAIGLIVLDYIEVLRFDIAPVFTGLLPFLVASNLFWWFLFKRKGARRSFLYLQILVDSFVIALGIFLSGGFQSEFIYIFFIPIVSAAMISPRAAVYSTLLVISLDLAVSYAEYFYRLSIDPEALIVADDHFITHIGVFVLMAVILGFQSYYFISRMKKRDEDILKIKDEFLFRVAHDLKSPLTAIKWSIAKYSGTKYFEAYPELKSDMDMIKKLDDNIFGLINDLTEIARNDAGQVVLKKEKVDIKSLMDAVMLESETLRVSKSVTIDYLPPKEPLFVLADSRALSEVLTNIFNNSLKYNKEGGKVKIVFNAENGVLKTEISDTGRGISKENLEKLFTPFFRGSVASEVPGTGLGLFLSKKLAEKMGGGIEVKSEEGKGSSFTLFLPVPIA